MANERFIVIQEWMLELGLNDSELRAFALIYGFSQDSETGFRGSIDYVAHWCQVQRRQAIYILNSLVEKGVVTKQEIPGQACAYYVRGVQFTAPVQPSAPVQSSAQRGAVQCTGGVQPSAPDNIENNIDNISTKSLSARAYGEKVMMTEDEHAKLVTKFGTEDTARLCEILDNYLVNNPRKHYTSHYRAILQWCVRELNDQKTSEQRLKNAQQPRTSAPNNGMAYDYGEQAMANARRLEELLKN